MIEQVISLHRRDAGIAAHRLAQMLAAASRAVVRRYGPDLNTVYPPSSASCSRKAPVTPLSTNPADRLSTFAANLMTLSPWHVRRLGLLLNQAGILLTAAGFSLSIALMNIGLVASLVGCVLAGAPLHRLVGFRPFLLLLLTLSVSTIAHHEWKELVKTAITPIGLLTAQIALNAAIPGGRHLRKALVATLLATIAVSFLVALGQYVIGQGKSRPFRIDADGLRFFQSSGLFSLHLTQGGAMGMLFFLVLAFTSQIKHAWGYVAAAATAIGVIISGARSCLLGFVAAIVVSSLSRGRRFAFAALIGGCVLLAAGLVVLRATSPERFDRLLSMQDGRWPIWRTTLTMIADDPWVGTGGSDGYRTAFRATYHQVVPDVPPEYPQGAPHAHNTPLAHAAEHGVPYAVAWVLLLVIPLWHLGRQRAEHPREFHAALGIAVMAMAFGQFEKLDGECSRVLWTSLGLLIALRSHTSNTSPSAVECHADTVSGRPPTGTDAPTGDIRAS